MHRIRGYSKVLQKNKRQFKNIELAIEHILTVDEDILLNVYIKEETLKKELLKPIKRQHIVWRKVNRYELNKFKYISLLQFSVSLIEANKKLNIKSIY